MTPNTQNHPRNNFGFMATVCAALFASEGAGQTKRPELPVVGHARAYTHTASAANTVTTANRLVDDHVVRIPGATFLCLEFASLRLPKGSVLEIRSLQDKSAQIFAHDTAQPLSAFFNGDAVRLRLFAGAASRNASYSIRRVFVGDVANRVGPASQCGPSDDRVPSSDARIARLWMLSGNQIIGGGTAFLFSNRNCFATAGHCLSPANLTAVGVEFNVPPSQADGTPVFAAATDQYLSTGSFQFQDNGPGADWGVFTTQMNANTRRHAGQVQGGFFSFSGTNNNQTVTVRGYGNDTSPLTRNNTLQTHTGPQQLQVLGILNYVVDTESGCSGGPVIGQNGRVIGVHTSGHCQKLIAVNQGTWQGVTPFVAARTTACKQLPDLTVTEVSIEGNPQSLVPNSSYVGVSRIRNIGNTSSGNFVRTHHLSSDNVISSSDLLLTSFSSESLSVMQSRERKAEFVVPPSTPPGSCFFGAIADRNGQVAELDESNNTLATEAIQCEQARVDYFAGSIGTNAFSLLQGTHVAVNFGVTNKGGAAATIYSKASIVLSDDTTITTSDRLLGTHMVNPLGPGDAYYGTSNVYIPEDVASGHCYLGLIVDSDHQIAESNESNNTKSSKRMQCGPAIQPDLIPSKEDLKLKTMWRKSPFQLRAEVVNRGHATVSKATQTHIYLSRDVKVSKDDTLLHAATLQTLTRYGRFQHIIDTRVPANVTVGLHYLLIVADARNEVVEIDETNNIRVVPIWFADRADLAVAEHRTGTATWQRGGRVSVTTTVRNQGVRPTSPDSTVSWFLSQDAKIDTKDMRLDSQRMPAIASTASARLQAVLTIPRDAPLGRCWIGAIADSNGRTIESIEFNNTASALGACVEDLPDLRASFSAPPSRLDAGRYVSISTRVHNAGRAASPSARIGIVLSLDKEISADDVLLGNYVTPELPPGRSATLTERFIVPFCTKGGNYYLGVIADIDGRIAEANESNNTASSAATCAAYRGSVELIEFVPRWNSAARTLPSGAHFRTHGRRNAQMCLTARRRAGRPYLMLWSGSSRFQWDGYASFAYSLINTPTFPAWFGVIDREGYGRLPRIAMPPLQITSRITIWNFVAFQHESGAWQFGAGGPIPAFIGP